MNLLDFNRAKWVAIPLGKWSRASSVGSATKWKFPVATIKTQIHMDTYSATAARSRDLTRMVCHVLPRGTCYSRVRSTSIDLYVSEMVGHSRLSNIVIAEQTSDALPAPCLIEMPSYGFARTMRRSRFIAARVNKLNPDVVVIQQHIPSAARISKLVDNPIILQRHNFVERSPSNDIISRYSYRLKTEKLNKLAGITFVSGALLSDFEKQWPDVHVPRTVIYNGFDREQWNSQRNRDNSVLVVGRAAPEKGILEAAEAVVDAVKAKPNWRADFVLSEEATHPEYFEKVKEVLKKLGERARLQLNRPYSEVKQRFESAAIAVIPSKWVEPFGRTCLEAHAGGAAVISSGTGGLRAISGDHALYIDPTNPRSIANALDALMTDDQLRRSLSKAGSERVSQLFDINTIAAHLDEFCLSVSHFREGARR